jgi:hypothetical protein
MHDDVLSLLVDSFDVHFAFVRPCVFFDASAFVLNFLHSGLQSEPTRAIR